MEGPSGYTPTSLPSVSQTLPLMHPATFPLTHDTSPSTTAGQVAVDQGGASTQDKVTTSLVEMLNRVDEFDQIPRIQIAQVDESGSVPGGVQNMATPTVYIQIPVSTTSGGQGLIPVSVPIAGQEVSMSTTPAQEDKSQRKGKQPWHYHLGKYTGTSVSYYCNPGNSCEVKFSFFSFRIT